MKGSLEKQGIQLQNRNAMYAGGGAAAAGASSAGAAPAAASAAAVTPRSGTARPKRPRCLLRVRTGSNGVNIWYAGSEFHKK